ncbi:ATP-dependent DNA helicase Rep [uncultured archaeon]|nr:ATP-dependent DNA helicase Rep [uncultured archaeon]
MITNKVGSELEFHIFNDDSSSQQMYGFIIDKIKDVREHNPNWSIGVLFPSTSKSKNEDMDGIKQELDKLNINYNSDYKSYDDTNRLVITTIHSSKGYEWDVVLVADLQTSCFPFKASNEFLSANLIYVAITRAKKELYLLAHSAIDFNYEDEDIVKVSKYLSLFRDRMIFHGEHRVIIGGRTEKQTKTRVKRFLNFPPSFEIKKVAEDLNDYAPVVQSDKPKPTHVSFPSLNSIINEHMDDSLFFGEFIDLLLKWVCSKTFKLPKDFELFIQKKINFLTKDKYKYLRGTYKYMIRPRQFGAELFKDKLTPACSKYLKFNKIKCQSKNPVRIPFILMNKQNEITNAMITQMKKYHTELKKHKRLCPSVVNCLFELTKIGSYLNDNVFVKKYRFIDFVLDADELCRYIQSIKSQLPKRVKTDVHCRFSSEISGFADAVDRKRKIVYEFKFAKHNITHILQTMMYAMSLGYEKCRIVNLNAGEVYKFKVPKDTSKFEDIVHEFLTIKNYIDIINKELHMSQIPVYVQNSSIISGTHSFPVQDMLSWSVISSNETHSNETHSNETEIRLSDTAKLKDVLEKYRDIKLNPKAN